MAVTAPMAITAISAIRRPYSSRSWPSSDRRNRLPAMRLSTATASGDCVTKLLVPPHQPNRPPPAEPGAGSSELELRRAGELRRDALEDRADRVAGRRDRQNRHEGDQRHEQRVLEQVLTLFLLRERLHVVNKHRHEILPRGTCTGIPVLMCG